MKYVIATWLILKPFTGLGQGTFQNLNFESADPVSDGPFTATAASAFPYWSVYSGNVQLTSVNYNDPDAGTTTVGLVGPSSPFSPGIDGNYSALLQGGVTASAASINQTGMIPAGTESLLFEAQPGPGPLSVFVGSQSVPISAVGTGANHTLYAAKISAWEGDPESLTFSAVEGFGGGNNWVIDDISFSPIAVVPEPSTLSLMLVAGVACVARRWRAKGS